MPVQDPSQSVDISAWPLDEDFAIFPVGSKPKRAVFCPDPAPCPFLIASHRYLFKASKDWRIFQHWSEIIAYHFAGLCGLQAAPCFVAIDSATGEVGIISEFFYGHPGTTVAKRFVPGADLLRRLIQDYEADPDRHHTVANILALNRSIVDRFARWGQLLTFDALIANTDRHPENWGILATRNQAGGTWGLDLAPSFDHGTSLAYQMPEAEIARESCADRVQLHLQRGKHHARWSNSNAERRHIEVCRLFAAGYPQAIPAMTGVLGFDEDRAKAALADCVRFNLPQGMMTEQRADYLMLLLTARREALKTAIGA